MFIPGKREIYEKTLELNICAEILNIVRSQPGYYKAVWQGLTQAQERAYALDEQLKNLGRGKHLMLQFKAPWASSPADRIYKFSINTRQHRTLEGKIAGRYPNAVFYVLPLFVTWSKVNNYAPNLVKDTWLLRAKDVNSKALGLTQERHRLEVEKSTSPPTATIYSPEINTRLLNAEETLRSSEDFLPIAGLIPSEALIEWTRSLEQQALPIRFRGLCSLFIPS